MDERLGGFEQFVVHPLEPTDTAKELESLIYWRRIALDTCVDLEAAFKTQKNLYIQEYKPTHLLVFERLRDEKGDKIFWLAQQFYATERELLDKNEINPVRRGSKNMLPLIIVPWSEKVLPRLDMELGVTRRKRFSIIKQETPKLKQPYKTIIFGRNRELPKQSYENVLRLVVDVINTRFLEDILPTFSSDEKYQYV